MNAPRTDALTRDDRSRFRDFEHAGWSGVSTFYHDAFAALTSQAVEPLLDAAQVGSGASVLDVATGPGMVAAAAARRGARPIGLDFAEPMVKLASRLHPGIEFRLGDAGELPFDDRSFDAAVSNYGMPHFADPERAIAEGFRVLRPGGGYAYSCWRPPGEARGFGLVFEAIRAHGDPDVPVPPGPPMYAMGEPETAQPVLEAAGFRGVRSTVVVLTWRLANADDLFAHMWEGTVRSRALLHGQPPDAVPAIRAAVRTAIAEFAADGGYAVPMPTLIVSGRRP